MPTAPKYLPADDPDVVAVTAAIQSGDLDAVRELLATRPELLTVRYGEEHGMSRTILHAATDFPGGFPRIAETIRLLIDAGADPDARFSGPHTETPLHWAASSDDIDAIDALLAGGADIEAPGGVLTGGPPLDDAVVFGQRRAGHRLVDAGASTRLFHAAALDLPARVSELVTAQQGASVDEITNALWHACRQGSTAAAKLLLDAGGDPLWVGWEGLTPLAAARAAGERATVELLEAATGS